jgi:hypothetical protein
MMGVGAGVVVSGMDQHHGRAIRAEIFLQRVREKFSVLPP